MIGLVVLVLVLVAAGTLLSRHIKDMRIHAAIMAVIAVVGLGAIALLSR